MATTLATTNEYPAGTRAVHFVFTTDKGSCSVTFDRYRTDAALFASVPQMTSNAIHSVMESGRKIEDFKTYYVD